MYSTVCVTLPWVKFGRANVQGRKGGSEVGREEGGKDGGGGGEYKAGLDVNGPPIPSNYKLPGVRGHLTSLYTARNMISRPITHSSKR
jgi:hypothetical protein